MIPIVAQPPPAPKANDKKDKQLNPRDLNHD